MSHDALRVAVIGVGHLGRHHARILATLPGVELVGGRRHQPARAPRRSPRPRGTQALTRLSRAASARSTPSPSRCRPKRTATIALPFLERGIAVLVEKPMARSLAEADAMIAAAADVRRDARRRAHRALQSGGRRGACRCSPIPRFIEVHRLGTFPERSLDIDVVFDLMIHDLDIVLSLVDSEVESIEAVGVPVLTGRVDIANARLRFANGCIANLTASRISRDRVRKIRFFQPAAYVSIDYAAQKVEVWRLVKRRGGERPSIEGGELPVAERGAAQARARRLRRRRRATSARPLVDRRGRPPRAGAGAGDCRQDGRLRCTTATSHDTRPRDRARDLVTYAMYSDLNDFLAALDKRKLLARIAEPVSPDLEIAAVTDRVCEVARRRAGAAVREARPASTCRSPPIVFGSMKRMCLALGVTTLDDLAREIDELIDAADARRACMDALKMLPMVGRLRDLMPKTVKDAPCQEVVHAERHARRAADPQVLARGRRPLHHAAAGLHEGSRDRRCATSAPIACRCSTAARPACTGSGTRAARSTTASPSGSASGSRSRSRSAPIRCCRTARPRRCPKGSTSCCSPAFCARERVELVKCVTVDLEVPASSHIVLEGYVEPGERRREGPFGDHTGFYSQPDDYPVFHLTCVTRRKKPDLPDDGRRHAADGGLLPRQGERADLPAADPEDAAGDRRHALSRPRASSTTS